MHSSLAIAFILASGASPGAKGAAEAHYKAGFDLAGNKKWIEALGEYRQAIAIVESELPETEQRRILPAIRYEVGLAAEHMSGGTAIAVDAFERYLDDPPERLNPEAKAHATRFLARFAKEVGRIAVIGPPDAKVTIDNEPAGALPLRRPAVVMPGAHAIAVSARGFSPDPARMSAIVGAGARVEVDANAALSAVVEAKAEPKIEPKPEPVHTPTVAEAKVLAPPHAVEEKHVESGGTDQRPAPQARSIGWPWLAGGVAAIAIGVVVDVVPSSGHDGMLEATDFLPLVFYLAGAACIAWFAWNLLGQSE